MATLEEIMADESTYSNDVTYDFGNGTVLTLGDMRKNFRSKDADYRQKTTRLAEDRRRLEEQAAQQQSAFLEAESKLAEWTKQLMAANPNISRDEVETELEADPRYRKLLEKMNKLEIGFNEGGKKMEVLEKQLEAERRMRFVLGHQQTIAGLRAQDTSLDDTAVENLIAFAQRSGIPNLEHAYFVMNKDSLLEKARSSAVEEATPKLIEKAKREFASPMLPTHTRLVKPAPDTAKSLDQAMENALSDPEIMGPLLGARII